MVFEEKFDGWNKLTHLCSASSKKSDKEFEQRLDTIESNLIMVCNVWLNRIVLVYRNNTVKPA